MSSGPPQGTGSGTVKRTGAGPPQEIPSVWPPQGYRTAITCSDDPSNPELQFEGSTNISTPLGAALDQSGELDVLFVGSELDDQVETIDVSDPTAPVQLDQLDQFGLIPHDVAIDTGRGVAYCMTDTEDKVVAVDISDPENISTLDEVTNFANGVKAGAIDQSRDILIVSEVIAGIRIIDTSDPNNLAIIGSVDQADVARPQEFRIDGTVAYMTEFSNDAIISWDISDETNPTHISTFSSATVDGAMGLGLTSDGVNAFVGARDAGQVVSMDVSDPANMSVLDTEGTGISQTQFGDLTPDEETFWIADSPGDRFNGIDVSDPNNISKVSQVDPLMNAPNRVVIGERGFKYGVTNSDQFVIWC